jgi:hypothetical protein
MFNLIKSLEEAHDLMYSLQNGSVDADHYRRVVARMEFALANAGVAFTPLLDNFTERVIGIVDNTCPDCGKIRTYHEELPIPTCCMEAQQKAIYGENETAQA